MPGKAIWQTQRFAIRHRLFFFLPAALTTILIHGEKGATFLLPWRSPMIAQVRCPNPLCGMVASVLDDSLGQAARCQRCGSPFTLSPSGDGSAAPAIDTPKAVAPAVLIGRYQVCEKLGSGAFGTVYRAYDPQLDREVALKVLRPEALTSKQAVERFQREARTAAKMHHPHIVPVFDAGHHGGQFFIASALIPGCTLASTIPDDGMEPRRAVQLTIQLVEALAYAHKQGVFHRDVKPANILLDDQDTLYLMDFGLAGWTEHNDVRLTKLGALVGTPSYMAPEQACGDLKQIGPATDLYSAGVVFYEMLTGRVPFEGPLAVVVYQVINVLPPSPSQCRPGLDPQLEAICLKALAKKPEERFASGQEMAAALRLWLKDKEPPLPGGSQSLEPLPRVPETAPGLSPRPVTAKMIGVQPAGSSPGVGRKTVVNPSVEKPSPWASPWGDIVAEAKRVGTTDQGPLNQPTQPSTVSVNPSKHRGTRNQTGARRPERLLQQWRPWLLPAGAALTVLLGMAVLLGTIGSGKQTEQKKQAEYLLLLDQSQELVKQKKFEKALETAQKAWALRRTDEVEKLLTQIKKEQKDLAESTRHLGQGQNLFGQQNDEEAQESAGKANGLPQTAEVKQQLTPIQERMAERKTLVIALPGGGKLEMARIDPGTLLMGSPQTEHQREMEEIQHKVTLTKGFYLQTTLVTQKQWQAIMGSNPSYFKGDDLPVEKVAWFDAVEFCIKLSEKEDKKPWYRLANVNREGGSITSAEVTMLDDGKGYRLPTEAEWEYAARAGTKTPFWCGETITTEQANFNGHFPYRDMDKKGDYREKTTPVTQFKANPWGLHDIHGNLWQWCEDWYAEYPHEGMIDPSGGKPGTSRVLRGGSWANRATRCRAAYRHESPPAVRHSGIGFRVALRLD